MSRWCIFISGPIGIDLSTQKLIYAKSDVSYLIKDYFEHKAQAKDIPHIANPSYVNPWKCRNIDAMKIVFRVQPIHTPSRGAPLTWAGSERPALRLRNADPGSTHDCLNDVL